MREVRRRLGEGLEALSADFTVLVRNLRLWGHDVAISYRVWRNDIAAIVQCIENAYFFWNGVILAFVTLLLPRRAR